MTNMNCEEKNYYYIFLFRANRDGLIFVVLLLVFSFIYTLLHLSLFQPPGRHRRRVQPLSASEMKPQLMKMNGRSLWHFPKSCSPQPSHMFV